MLARYATMEKRTAFFGVQLSWSSVGAKNQPRSIIEGD